MDFGGDWQGQEGGATACLVPKEDQAAKLTVRLDGDLGKRRGVAAAMTRRSKGELVQSALRGYLAQVRLGSAILPPDRPEAVGEATGAVPGDDGEAARSGRDGDAA